MKRANRATSVAVLLLWLVAGAVRGDEAQPAAGELQPALIEEEEEERALRGELGEWASWRAEPSTPGPGDWTIGWRDGLRIGRRDGRTAALVGGELILDGGLFRLDDALRPSGGGWHGKTEVRRARIFVQGLLFQDFFFKLSYDAKDGELKDAYLGIRHVGPILAAALGQIKAPFSLENDSSLRNQPFLERSLASALAPGRNPGVLATGQLFDARLRWAVGAFFLDDSRRQEEETVRGYQNDEEIAFRLTGLPIWRDEGRSMLLLGVSYAHAFAGGDEELRIMAPPETQLVEELLSTGPMIGVSSIERVALEFAAIRGPLWIQAEWVANRYQRSTGDLDFWGGSVQAGWLLSGEHRRYGRAAGVFGRIVPKRPFSWRKRRFGAFEVAGRISHLDLNDEGIRGGQELNMTLAFNWYLRAHLRVGFNWVHGRVHGRGDLDVFQARLQIDL